MLLNEPWLPRDIVLDPMNKVNPDNDVPATGAFEVYYITDRQYAIYAPNWLDQGTMNTERLQLLYQAYSKSSIFNSGQNPEAVAKLLRRYKDGHKSQTYKTIHKYQRATPKSVLRANAFQITAELFVSPLNFSSESTVYCSPYAENTEFGAHRDVYSFRWKDSCFCHPEGTDEQLRRSVQWLLPALNCILSRSLSHFCSLIDPSLHSQASLNTTWQKTRHTLSQDHGLSEWELLRYCQSTDHTYEAQLNMTHNRQQGRIHTILQSREAECIGSCTAKAPDPSSKGRPPASPRTVRSE